MEDSGVIGSTMYSARSNLVHILAEALAGADVIQTEWFSTFKNFFEVYLALSVCNRLIS